MLIDEKIAQRIDDVKRNALNEAQELINSPAGATNTIPLKKVRNMRMRILKDFEILQRDVLAMIRDDILTGMGDDMHGLKTRLQDLRKRLADAESEQKVIMEQWKELMEINKKIKTGR